MTGIIAMRGRLDEKDMRHNFTAEICNKVCGKSGCCVKARSSNRVLFKSAATADCF